ncbi:MAG: glycosyltransferase [Acidaminococcaceae bacterium]
MSSNNTILFIGRSALHYPQSFATALATLGFKIEKPNYLTYTYPNRWERLFRKKQYNQTFLNKQSDLYLEALQRTKPQFVFIVNHYWVNEKFLTLCQQKNIPVYGYLMDAVRWYGYALELMHLYTTVYSYEPSDSNIDLINGKHIQYLACGFNPCVFNAANIPTNKKFDLSFVGRLEAHRLELLEAVAKYAHENNLKLIIYTSIQLKTIGNLWLFPKILVRRLKFAYKYKYLYRCLVNEPVSETKLATIYKQSKICLNIHVGTHAGLHTGSNVRTFEALACHSFQLIDAGHLEQSTLNSPQHLVEFTNSEDLCRKIGYYLTNEDIRENIAEAGYQEVHRTYTVMNMMKTILAATPFQVKS